MARYYNRRDRLMHWVRREQPTGRHCTHACCRGYREHPEHWPVILPSRKLRHATDEDLAQHFQRVSYQGTGESRRAEVQILAEMQRRDDVQRMRRDRAEAVAANRAARRMEREADAERIKAEAEAYTKGYLVTAQGQARGITDAEILSGRQEVFIRYATPEAKAYFAEHPRPTGAYFRGRDTRIVYSDRPAPRRPVTPRRTRALGWGTAPGPGRSRGRVTRALGWGDERKAG